jgi:hypothetical protein
VLGTLHIGPMDARLIATRERDTTLLS